VANLRLPIDLAPITDGLRTISETMKTMRDSVAILPEVAASLEEIQKATVSMAKEVHLMRVGVDALGKEVDGMRAAVEPLVPHMDLVAERVERLEPRLEDLSLALHPLRRATGKRARRRVSNDDSVEVAAEESAQTESGENVSQSDGSPEE